MKNQFLKHIADKRQQVRDEESLIAILVTKLGGSVIITDKELIEYDGDLLVERVATGRLANRIRVKKKPSTSES